VKIGLVKYEMAIKQRYKLSLSTIFLFLTLPLTTLAIIPNFYNQTSIPKLYALILSTFLVLVLNRNAKLINNLPLAILILLNLMYIFNQFRLKQDFETFVLGSNGRYVGILALLCLTLQFVFYTQITSSEIVIFSKFLIYSSYLLNLIGLIILSGITSLKEFGYFGGLSITMQNSNFLSAYLGIVLSIHLFVFIIDKKNRSITSLIFFVLGLVNLFATKSLQGIIILSCLTVTIIVWKILSLGKLKIKQVLLFVTSIFLLFLLKGNSIVNWFIINANVKARLSYWELAFEIWRENPWFGVGLEQMRPYSIIFRDLGLTLQEGVIVAPDRSHNLILDHFVWGGAVAGVLWLVFNIIISYRCFKILYRITKNQSEEILMIPVLLWLGFLIQSLISVSPLTLTLVGYLAAGLIVGSNQKIGKLKND
jgi:O-antigen ligase